MIDYYLLTKPGIILGNLITFAAGFLLASRGSLDLPLFLFTLLGLALIIASACVFNNYIDRTIDQKMNRTSKRALASGTVNTLNALLFASLLLFAGNLTLILSTNILTLIIANIGFFIYIFPYSFLKYTTHHSTLIGSIAGATPPVIGYCAVSNQLDAGAALLFFILILWQMPHFYAIALWHLDDYAKANIPLLPLSYGIHRTKIHITLYIASLIPTVALLTLFGYTGLLFLSLTTCMGLIWLYFSIKGFKTDNTAQWGHQMFRLSLLMINAICLLIPIDLLFYSD